MHKKSLSSSLRFGSVLLGLSVFLSSAPAFAGFQWISPQEPAAAGESAAPVSLAPAKPSVEALPPAQIIEGKAAPSFSAPAAPTGTIVRGFANKVPLSVALRQILPAEVGFSVAQDVDMNQIVSWKGGAPWQQVLSDVLSPLDLTFKEQGPLIQVSRVSAKAPPVAASKPMGAPARPTEMAKPVLPPASTLPTQNVPDRNMPGGVGGVLGAPVPLAAAATPAPVPSTIYASAAPTTSTPPYDQAGAVSDWSANKGMTLQGVLEDWCRRTGVELSWQAEYDYPLQASVSLSGTFETAVRNLLTGFQDATPQPVAYLYNNRMAGQTVLVVQVRGNSYNQ